MSEELISQVNSSHSSKAKTEENDSARVQPILSNNEKKFYDVLQEIFSKTKYDINIKVRLIDIFGDKNLSVAERNKRWAKHIDFMILDINSAKIVSLIELDDKSHSLRSRRESDNYKNFLSKKYDIPLVRFSSKPISQKYNKNEIRYRLIRQVPGLTLGVN